MRNGYLLEIDDRDAGLLIREGKSYAFVAVGRAFQTLDGKMFANIGDAERAARRLARHNALGRAA